MKVSGQMDGLASMTPGNGVDSRSIFFRFELLLKFRHLICFFWQIVRYIDRYYRKIITIFNYELSEPISENVVKTKSVYCFKIVLRPLLIKSDTTNKGNYSFPIILTRNIL